MSAALYIPLYTLYNENRLTQIALPDGTRNTTTYDGNGKRWEKQESTGTTKFIWDGEKVVVETDGAGATQAVYTMTPSKAWIRGIPEGTGFSRYNQWEG